MRKSHSQLSYAKKPPNHPTVVRVVMARLEEERHASISQAAKPQISEKWEKEGKVHFFAFLPYFNLIDWRDKQWRFATVGEKLQWLHDVRGPPPN